ncbi:MAG: DUF2283 domain-containing protein [Candidatus Eisenbacteria bacterium]|nr:DUF2283 domain-containing protein [Candidatus Eisenbacteria bacterium]
MRLVVDREDDALHFCLDETGVVESEEVRPGVVLGFDGDGRAVGVEFLRIAARASKDQLSFLYFQTG